MTKYETNCSRCGHNPREPDQTDCKPCIDSATAEERESLALWEARLFEQAAKSEKDAP